MRGNLGGGFIYVRKAEVLTEFFIDSLRPLFES